MRKFFTGFMMALIVLFLLPFNTSAAESILFGAGEWDKVGTSETIKLYRQQVDVTQRVSSGGGNFQLRVTNAQANNFYVVWLYEYDPNDFNGTLIGKKYGYGNSNLTWDVSKYAKEEADGKAEIYAHIGYADIEEDITINFYD
ncbi:hypothetical protein AB1L07_12050 [Niallia alba]|uniref:hypothetical protein n=1 Tax=Niallia alba TaxID=2729105 RepID=UPI000332A413|nr:hypothetical protein A499_18876 [Niallia nealsonii AAU1]